MDPISALSLAANVVQFVDCGFKFISTIIKIYQSATGSLVEHHELDAVVKNLRLQSTLIANQPMSGLSNNPAMASILESCVAVSSELQDELSSITRSFKPGSTKSVTNSIIAAVRSMMKSNKIKELEVRFVRLREQLAFHLTATLYEHRTHTEAALTELIGAEKAFHHSTIYRLERVMKALEDIKTSRFARGHEDVYLPAEEVESFKSFADMFTAWIEERKAERIQAIIKSLEFPQITDRETSILEAHKTTFEWAFSKEKTNLASWLSDGSGIYWVSGKAGSGKSTLFKFLTAHEKTNQALQTWADSEKKILVTASHYFWAQGTALQKSHKGLLQTLLCQILIKHPDQVSTATPTRWSSWTDMQEPWSLPELSKCFEAMALTNKFRICLFIDGLDEYQGDHQDLIDALETLTASEHVKICASSRPWIEFTSAFGSRQWKLQVQDLTLEDISSYSRDKLKSDKHIGSYGSEVDRIAQEISQRAQGVFLWVYLVVRSLIRGMRYMDTIDDLWERLNELPTDLEEFFSRMLESIEPIYRKRTARALRVLSHIQSETTKPVITFYFMDLEMKDPDYALGSLRSPTAEDETEFYGRMEREKKHQLVAQCRDLVHVLPNPNSKASHPPWSTTASFLHRTVADFLKTSDVSNLLFSRSGDDFDPRVSICRSYLAQVKIMQYIQKPHNIQWDSFIMDDLMTAILYNARYIEMVQGRTERRILDALTPFFRVGRSHVNEIFSQKCTHFLNLAVRLGLSIYTKELLADHEERRKDALVAALMKPMWITVGAGFEIGVYDDINLEIARHVLELGVSPNEPADTANDYHIAIPITIWSQFLQQLVFEMAHANANRRLGCSKDTAFRILHLLLSHGASPSAVDWQVLSNTFPKDRFNELKFAWGSRNPQDNGGKDPVRSIDEGVEEAEDELVDNETDEEAEEDRVSETEDILRNSGSNDESGVQVGLKGEIDPSPQNRKLPQEEEKERGHVDFIERTTQDGKKATSEDIRTSIQGSPGIAEQKTSERVKKETLQDLRTSIQESPGIVEQKTSERITEIPNDVHKPQEVGSTRSPKARSKWFLVFCCGRS